MKVTLVTFVLATRGVHYMVNVNTENVFVKSAGMESIARCKDVQIIVLQRENVPWTRMATGNVFAQKASSEKSVKKE